MSLYSSNDVIIQYMFVSMQSSSPGCDFLSDFIYVLGLFTFDEELKHESSRHYQGKPTDSTPFGLSSDDDDDSSTDGKLYM